MLFLVRIVWSYVQIQKGIFCSALGWCIWHRFLTINLVSSGEVELWVHGNSRNLQTLYWASSTGSWGDVPLFCLQKCPPPFWLLYFSMISWGVCHHQVKVRGRMMFEQECGVTLLVQWYPWMIWCCSCHGIRSNLRSNPCVSASLSTNLKVWHCFPRLHSYIIYLQHIR